MSVATPATPACAQSWCTIVRIGFAGAGRQQRMAGTTPFLWDRRIWIQTRTSRTWTTYSANMVRCYVPLYTTNGNMRWCSLCTLVRLLLRLRKTRELWDRPSYLCLSSAVVASRSRSTMPGAQRHGSRCLQLMLLPQSSFTSLVEFTSENSTISAYSDI